MNFSIFTKRRLRNGKLIVMKGLQEDEDNIIEETSRLDRSQNRKVVTRLLMENLLQENDAHKERVCGTRKQEM